MSNFSLKILIESHSPNCPLNVIVEEDEYTTYMYLNKTKNGKFDSIICAGWIRNHGQGIDEKNMSEHHPPMLSAEYCNHPQGKKRLNPENLECIWFEDGNGVALLEKDDILCVIPSWVGNNFPPYAKDCIKENPLAVPLGEDNTLTQTILKAKEYWNSWNEDFWDTFRDNTLALLERYLGKHTNYYAIDGERWPPKCLVRFDRDGITYLITLGTSLIPQPTVELYSETPENLRRIELGLAIKTNDLKKNEKSILQFISATTNIPWENISWLGHGHTIECKSIFDEEDTFPFCLLVKNDSQEDLPLINFPSFRDDVVNLLWLTPITSSEFDMVQSVGVCRVLEHIRKKGRSLIFTNKDKEKNIYEKFKRKIKLFIKTV